MKLLDKYQAYIKKEDLFQPGDKLLIAVSGGVDSVVLCELCKEAGHDFVIAHCNFKLRGEESERDEDFVNVLAKNYGVDALVKKFETEKYAEENKMSIQVAARQLRYSWFNEVAAAASARYILTAHHANDNIETLLMNFFKGTGIKGLHGILPKQGNIIRPLLFARKNELVEFATANKLDFVEDSSNASDKYSRNYFRNQIIPDVEKLFPQVEENLLHNIERFRGIEILYHQAVDQARKNLLEPRGNEIHIPVLKLRKTAALKTVIFEIIKDFGFTAQQTDEAVALLIAETGKYIQSGSHRIIKNRNWLIISPNASLQVQHMLLEGEGNWQFADGRLQVRRIINDQYSIHNDQLMAQLDADNITFPLLLRKWEKGDYFYPLGMQKKAGGRPGKKKLSRFFTDQKLSLTQKEKTWVIEMNKKIIWVVGLRIDDRFKIKGSTKNILQIILSFAK